MRLGILHESSEWSTFATLNEYSWRHAEGQSMSLIDCNIYSMLIHLKTLDSLLLSLYLPNPTPPLPSQFLQCSYEKANNLRAITRFLWSLLREHHACCIYHTRYNTIRWRWQKPTLHKSRETISSHQSHLIPKIHYHNLALERSTGWARTRLQVHDLWCCVWCPQ